MFCKGLESCRSAKSVAMIRLFYGPVHAGLQLVGKNKKCCLLTVYDRLTRPLWQNLKKWQKTRLGIKSDKGRCPNYIPFGISNQCITKTKKYFRRMKPIADRVIVKPAPADEKTKGGLIIPDTAKEKPQRGEIVAVGPGKDGNLMTVQVGDIVLYGKYSGQEVNIDGQDFLIMREDDILVVI